MNAGGMLPDSGSARKSRGAVDRRIGTIRCTINVDENGDGDNLVSVVSVASQ
jgi:hypothetical protein